MGRVHIVGAGLSGLACATALAAAGHLVTLYEATDHAGGRCRSWHDAHLDRVIDNGNHLILGANRECLSYLDRIGGRDGLVFADPVALPFHDLRDGTDWCLRPGNGPLPLWLMTPSRRVPGTRFVDYLSALRLALAGPQDRVADLLPITGVLAERLWKPLAVSILNTPYQDGSARLLWSVFRRTLLRGAVACQPIIAGPGGLSAALVDPALAFLNRYGVTVRFGQRLKSLDRGMAGDVTALTFTHETLPIPLDDRVVLALPAEASASLLPGVTVPDRFHAILNAHFQVGSALHAPPLLGLVGGTAEWLFCRRDILSVTVSAADALMDQPTEALAMCLWADVRKALRLTSDAALPPYRVVKERRATFAATPDQEHRRPASKLARNLYLAGDWTDTGLPATIEGAVQSGHRVATRLVNAARHSAATRTRG